MHSQNTSKPSPQSTNKENVAFDGLPRNTRWFSGLQANILKSHGRDNHALILLSFSQTQCTALRTWLSDIPVTRFDEQLSGAEDRRKNRHEGTPEVVRSVWLSATGYAALGFRQTDLPSDRAFREGMVDRGRSLGDPPRANWDGAFQGEISCVVALAHDDAEELGKAVQELQASAHHSLGYASVLGVERGTTDRSSAGVREHFGFADGVSNPVFLRDDIRKLGPRTKFDDRARKELALVRDPLAPEAWGSYVVLRKIEQDLRAFDKGKEALADALGLSGEDRRRAGAMIVGRFEDGTPLVDSANPSQTRTNDFDYGHDPAGARCPFQAHARKMNDRGDGLRKGDWPEEVRRRRIVRRGFHYGGTPGEVERVSEGVGLFFVSFQASIEGQFEKLQRDFANNDSYFLPGSGADALVGRDANSTHHKWPKKWGDAGSRQSLPPLGDVTRLRGGAYLFAPSADFLAGLDKNNGTQTPQRGAPSTPRVAKLRESLVERAFGNRQDEWFTARMLGGVPAGKDVGAVEPVIVRKALACRRMLQAMTDPENSRTTRSFEIEDGELIVGRMPLGSVGLGKTFPTYLTEDEARVAAMCNRDEPSVFGHTVPNFKRVLELGLAHYVRDASERAVNPEFSATQRDFYRSVAIVCEAVVSYATAFAQRALTLAESATGSRRAELLEVARVCTKVPAEPAESFHEAVQCIWFVHLAQTAFSTFNSLGRLDQTLAPYLRGDNHLNHDRALELLECFFVKGAERLHLNPATLEDADHLSFGTGIGTRPIYLDQVASSNNFIQNIVIGGVDKNGRDAENEVTHLLLEACGNIALCTPTLNVRVHSGTSKRLLNSIERCFKTAETGLPILYNDSSVIKGLEASGIPLADARDYACAGCWEPVLSGKCSFTFGMVNMLRVLECTLNGGRLLTNGEMFLKGQKQSVSTPEAADITCFDDLKDIFETHLSNFADKVALGTGAYYLLPGEVTPTPFLSLLLDGCYERGVDQGRGGADFNLAGNLAIAMPNAINALANLERFVFTEERWDLREVLDALRWNWGVGPIRSAYEVTNELDGERIERMQGIRRAFLNEGEKWANGHDRVEAIGKWLATAWHTACERAAGLTNRTFLSNPTCEEGRKLRGMANYQGQSLAATTPDQRGEGFSFNFTHGAGTFGQYSSMGQGVPASADGRAAHDPVAPNCSPPGGTATHGIGELWSSLTLLGLDRFGCGVVTDIRVDGTSQDAGFFSDLVHGWAIAGGSILTISCLPTVDIEEVYRLAESVRAGIDDVEVLRPYCDLMCRVGGWNSAYACLPRGQQRDHLLRAQW